MVGSRNSASPDPLWREATDVLRRHLGSEDGSCQTLIVGFSGGRDSVALLHLLHCLQADWGYRLEASHVNHGISPFAGKWQRFCVEFCASLSIPCAVSVIDVPRGTSSGLEAAAREARYAVWQNLKADWLLLGQHRADQAETLLLNLLRGAGLRGAAAIPAVRLLPNGPCLLRPLLNVKREDIQAYLTHHRLCWIDDESNNDVTYSRNFLRHRVMPVVTGRFPSAEANLAAAARRFGEAVDLLDELAVLDLAGRPALFPVPVSCFSRLSERRARNLLRFLLFRHDVRIAGDARLSETLRQLLSAGPDRHPAVAMGEWTIYRRRGLVFLEKTVGDVAE